VENAKMSRGEKKRGKKKTARQVESKKKTVNTPGCQWVLEQSRKRGVTRSGKNPKETRITEGSRGKTGNGWGRCGRKKALLGERGSDHL